MYIHDYWNNPKKYDIYGDDFVFDLPGTEWQLNTGKWLSGPTSQTYLEQTGVPFTREEIGSQRYIDFINSFLTQSEIDNGRWRYKYCIPASYSTHEDLHPELRMFPNGGPDWSIGSSRALRLNNQLRGTQFELHGWEGREGPNNGNNINTWNTGTPPAYPISDKHIITSRHFYISDTGFFQFGTRTWYFLNKDNEIYRKKFKFVGYDWTEDQKDNFSKMRSFSDAFLLELEEEESGFSSIGITPSETMARLVVSGQDINEDGSDVLPFFHGSQGKQIATYQLDPQGRGNICHTPIFSGDNTDSNWGQVNADEASVYILSDYAKIFEGDSGTLSWCYSPTQGHIFLGGNNGANGTLIGQVSITKSTFAAIRLLIKNGLRSFPSSQGGSNQEETHPSPLTPITNYELPFELIQTPTDLKQEVVRYDLPTEINTKICEVDLKANVSDSFGNTAQTNSITSKTDIESFYDHSSITDDPNQQFPKPHTVRIAVEGNSEYPEELKESTYDNEIFTKIYADFQYGQGYLEPEKVQTIPMHYITCNMEYKVPGLEDWVVDANFAGIKKYVRHPVIGSPGVDGRSNRSSIFGLVSRENAGGTQIPGTQFRIKTQFVSQDYAYETTFAVGTVQDFREPTNFRLEFDPKEVYPGNEFILTLAWNDPDGGVNPIPRLSPDIQFQPLQGGDLIEFNRIDESTVSAKVSDVAESGDSIIGTFANVMYGPHDLETIVGILTVIGIPTVSFTDDSTAQNAEVTVDDEILLEANLTDYVGGTITATINIDGVPVVSETITDATELDSDLYSLSYLTTQENANQNVDWSYSISVSNLAGDSPVQTRSGTIKQLPKIIVNPTSTSPGAVVTNGDEIVIDVDLVNMDANGTATANIVVDGVTVETTTLTSEETSLNLVHTVQNILADTVWSLDVTLINNFGSVSYNTNGTVDIIETTPTITVNEEVSTSGTIVLGDTIVLEATIENYNSVVGSITINGIDTGASGTLTGDLYRIEYTTALDEVDTTSNWVSTITASSATESTEVRTGSITIPDLTASLIINPDVDDDGFVDTYVDSMKVITNKTEDEIEQYKWTIKTPKVPYTD